MPQVIEVPGVGPVEFPDGMDDAAIVKAIRGLAPTAKAESVEKANPAEGIGAWESIPIAAGKATDRILDGFTQMYLGARGEDKALAGLKQNVAEKDASYAPLKAAHPIATGVGEALPMLAIPAGGGAGLGLVARSAAAGAVPGALSYGSIAERTKAAGLGAAGGAIGGGIATGASRLLKPSGAGVSGLSDDALAAAERLGFKLSAGQRSQNPAMLSLENYLAKSPGSSKAMQATANANQSALNRAGAKAMGQQADDLSEGVFSTAKNAIGGEFDRLQSITSPQLGNDFLKVVSDIDAANMARGSFKSPQIDKLIDQSLDLAVKGKLSGTAYKEIRSQLSSEANKAFKAGDATLGQSYKAIRKALDDAAEQSLSAADKKAWATTREQWKAYKTLTKSNVAEAGNLSAPRLAAAVRREGDGLRTGAARGPLADVARLGEAVKGVSNPNSGQLTQQMLYNNPLTGVPMLLGNKVLGAAYNNRPMQAYMARGLLDVGKEGEVILGKIGQPLGLPALQQYLGAQ